MVGYATYMQEIIQYKLIKFPFKQHKKFKNKLLSYFKEEPFDKKNSVNMDDLYKCDFHDSTNPSRPWVEMLLPSFMKSFETFLNQMEFKTLQFKDIWFQQYKKDNTHHWHIHGCTFTGVYYVKYNEKCIGTELIDPITKKVMMPAVYEGDVIIFPSYVKHRAPPQITNTLKTIISFNFDCDI